MSDYAACGHLPLLESAWTEQHSAEAKLCMICDTLYCPQCADKHEHRPAEQP